MIRRLRAFALALFCFVVVSCSSTQPAKPPDSRAIARASVKELAVVLQASVHLCTVTSQNMRAAGNSDWKRLETICADAYDRAAPWTTMAARAVDAWDAMSRSEIGCAASMALGSLRIIADELGKLKVIPAALALEIEDGITLGQGLAAFTGGVCTALPPTSSPQSDSGAESPASDAADASETEGG